MASVVLAGGLCLFDEVDGYPPSAGSEGDQIKLGIRRTEYYWNRKIVSGSTPTVKDFSRIERMYQQSDAQAVFCARAQVVVTCSICVGRRSSGLTMTRQLLVMSARSVMS